MPKKSKSKTQEEHSQTIEYLLAGLLLKRDVDVHKVAKIMGCRVQNLTKLFPERRKGKK